MSKRIKVYKPQGADKIIVEAGGAIRIQPGGVITIGEGAPVNATAATATIAAADIAITADGDTVKFANSEFVKDATPEAGEWNDATALAALINALDDWNAAVDTGAVVITAATKGAVFNGAVAIVEVVEDTTAGGDVAAKAAATIAAATIARLAVGDSVGFAGSTFVMASETDVARGEFADAAGLIECINAMDDWTAVNDAGDIDITAVADGADYNDVDVMVFLSRKTATGADGTVGKAGDMYADDTYLYVASADNGISDNNWRKIALGNVY